MTQQDVQDELAGKGFGGERRDGEAVAIDAQDGRLTFTPAMSAAPLVA